MASLVSIANMALARVGSNRIASLTENTTNARAINACFEDMRKGELRKHRWKFAIEMIEVPADADEPIFGRNKKYQLPADFLRLLPRFPEEETVPKDWLIQGSKIFSDEDGPLQIRYIQDITDANLMDPLFRIALSLRIAKHVCEELTQSNTKQQLIQQEYKEAIAEARAVDALEKPPEDSTIDDWILSRDDFRDNTKRGFLG